MTPQTTDPVTPSAATALRRLRAMMLIRCFEERVYREFITFRILPDGSHQFKIGGFVHLYSGQEAIAVGIGELFQQRVDAL
jgi:TPP-dependent pyruvate/acetoin dehydrogenase alpha subunit